MSNPIDLSHHEVIMPSEFYLNLAEDSQVHETSLFWTAFETILSKVNIYIRNVFYLPFYHHSDAPHRMDEKMARQITFDLKYNVTPCDSTLKEIKENFSIRDIRLHVEKKEKSLFFNLRTFESTQPIQNKKFRLILFSFYGNKEKFHNHIHRWEPLSIRSLSSGPLYALKALQNSGIRIDSLMTTSLGNVIYEGLQHLPQEYSPTDLIPPTLIINRGLTSIRKTINKLYPRPLNFIFYLAAKIFKWDANPEQKLLNFLQNRNSTAAGTFRRVFIIEAIKDFYFSEQGGFQKNLHKKIARLGIAIFRGSFYPFPFHSRSHHALSLDHFILNTSSQIFCNKLSFINKNEKGNSIPSILANSVFLAGNESWHTCFYVCGNDATLNLATAREAVPLLAALLKIKHQ